MLRSLLIDLVSSDPEVEVVEDAEGPPDVLLVSDAHPENEALALDTLMSLPRSRVLVLTEDGRRAILWELRPHRTALGELSRESLLAAVHGTPEVGA